MEIRTQQQLYRNPINTGAAAKAAPAASEEAPTVPVDGFSGILSYVDPDTTPAQLPTSAPPRLERPTLFVHGFTGNPESFKPFTDWFSQGGANTNGGVLDPNNLGTINPEGDLFSIRFSRAFNSIETNSAEMKRTIDAICRATGKSEVDVVVHSLGGLDTRDILRDADERIKRFVMVATPNHGSQLANLELVFREKFGYPIKPPDDDPEVRKLLNQMRVDRNGSAGQPENPYLREMNNGWPAQRSKAEGLLFAGVGIPTLTGPVGITVFGDGVVPRKSAELDGLEVKSVWFKTHGALLKSANVIENTGAFLATGRTLTEDANLYDSPADEAKAKELMAQEQARETAAAEMPSAGGATLAQVQAAAQQPILDPAFQFGMTLGVLAALMGGPKEALPLVNINMTSSQGQSALQAAYSVDMLRSSDPLRGTGTNNGTTFAEKGNLVDSKLHWQSQDGSSGMVLEVNDDERSINMKGRLNGVDANLRLSPFVDGQGNIEGIETKGTLNGEQYFMKSTIDVEGLFGPQGRKGTHHHEGEMHVVGLVNGQAVEKNYTVGVQRRGAGLHLTARGSGVNVGLQQDVGVDIRVTDRD